MQRYCFSDYPSEVPKLPPVPLTASEVAEADSRLDMVDESAEDTLKSGVETSVEMDHSTDVEMADS